MGWYFYQEHLNKTSNNCSFMLIRALVTALTHLFFPLKINRSMRWWGTQRARHLGIQKQYACCVFFWWRHHLLFSARHFPLRIQIVAGSACTLRLSTIDEASPSYREQSSSMRVIKAPYNISSKPLITTVRWLAVLVFCIVIILFNGSVRMVGLGYCNIKVKWL